MPRLRAPFALAAVLAATAAPPAVAQVPSGAAPAGVATGAQGTAPTDSAARAVTALADEFMAALIERFPELPTVLGLPGRRHDRLTDLTPAARSRWDAREDAWLARARRLDPAPLIGRPEWVTLGFLREALEANQGTRACRSALWSVNQMSGWQAELPFLAQLQPVGTPELRAQAVARARAVGPYLAADLANLRAGVRQGYTSPRGNVERVLAQVDGLLASPPARSPFLSPAERDTAAPPAFRRELQATVTTAVYPAIRRYRDYLRTEYLPAARRTTAVADLPGGAACYRASARAASTLDVEPREIHAIGRREMERIVGEMRTIGRRSFGTDDVPALLARLRTDTAYTFRTREDVVALARAALDRARTQARPAFGIWPKAEVVLDPYLPFEEASAVDSYVNPSDDGSRPGRYRINTSNPTRKPRTGLESTAFHETIPGHHLQIAIAQERRGAHPLTRFLGNSGFAEGWALYAERLSEEIGMFSSDVDRMGLLSNEALRAARLVVDPGLHVLGWTRQQAIDYMLQHTAESREEIEREVDRYIVWPGQATAYMLGRIEIMRLRDEARRTLGPRFTLPAFHDRVLEDGALTLPMLRTKVERWIARDSSAAATGTPSTGGASAP